MTTYHTGRAQLNFTPIYGIQYLLHKYENEAPTGRDKVIFIGFEGGGVDYFWEMGKGF